VTDDGALVAAARAGDRDALERLLREHYDRIHLVCRRITGSEADAADATQEALLAIVRGLAKFDGRSSFATR
jgi:RNA polymerase sigma-70 factor (ECF subfamily)